MIEIEARMEWLMYETGFLQLYPTFEITDWMQQQGYKYDEDWTVSPAYHYIEETDTKILTSYCFQFPNKTIAELFLLKWS